MTLRAIKRWLTLSSTLAALSSTIVTAQEPKATEPKTTDEKAMPPLEQAAPPETGAPEPGQERLPPCPLPPPQAEAVPPAVPPPPAPVEKHARKHNIVFAPQEVSMLAGAGVANYFGGAMPASVDAGAAWTAHVTFGTHSIMALEAGYVGGINELNMSGQSANVTSNGFDGDFRLQLPYRVQPYIFSGVGYNHMDLNATNGSVLPPQMNNHDDQVTVPSGGGLAAYLGKNSHATLDLRGTYRYIPDSQLTIHNAGALHQWVAQARIGYAF
jgi:hypothetical protein